MARCNGTKKFLTKKQKVYNINGEEHPYSILVYIKERDKMCISGQVIFLQDSRRNTKYPMSGVEKALRNSYQDFIIKN